MCDRIVTCPIHGRVAHHRVEITKSVAALIDLDKVPEITFVERERRRTNLGAHGQAPSGRFELGGRSIEGFNEERDVMQTITRQRRRLVNGDEFDHEIAPLPVRGGVVEWCDNSGNPGGGECDVVTDEERARAHRRPAVGGYPNVNDAVRDLNRPVGEARRQPCFHRAAACISTGLSHRRQGTGIR